MKITPLLIIVFSTLLLLSSSVSFAFAEPTITKVEMRAVKDSDGWTSTQANLWLSDIAPWDIASIKVTGPEGSGYEQIIYNYQINTVTNYKTGMFYRVWLYNHQWDAPTATGDYTFELLDFDDSVLYTDFVYNFAYNELTAVDVTSYNHIDSTYIDSSTPTMTWDMVTNDFATVYYRIRIQEYNNSVSVYVSDLSTDTSATVLADDDYLASNTSYKWRVEVLDNATDETAHNVSQSDWQSFSTGSSATPLAITWGAFMRSRVKSDGSFRTQMGIGFEGPSPSDVTIEVTGPGVSGSTYTLDKDTYFQDGYYFNYSENDGKLDDGDYTFTVTDTRTGGETVTTVPLAADWTLTAPDEDQLNIEWGTYLDTEKPTMSWEAIPGVPYYLVKIFDYNWNYIHGSARQLDTIYNLSDVPTDILKKDTAYYWRVETYEKIDNPATRADGDSNSFFVANDNTPANISGTISIGSSTAGGPIYVIVTNNDVFPGGEEFGYTFLTSPGAYEIMNVPREIPLYVHALYDADSSESYTFGDWKGVSAEVTLALGGPLPNPGNDASLTTLVAGASVSGTVTCTNCPADAAIYIGAYEDSDPDPDDIPIGSISITGTDTAYTISDLPVDGELWFFAFWDADLTATPSNLDHYGEHGNPVIILASNNPDVGITIQTTGFVTGKVTEADEITPISEMYVYASDPNTGYRIYRSTDENGMYYIPLDSGTYNVTACPSCAFPQQMPYSDQQKSVSVTNPEASTLNFSLDPAFLISGYVTALDGTPIVNANVYAQEADADCWGNHVSSAMTDDTGYYEFYAPANSSNYVRTNASDYGWSPDNSFYIDEYYDGSTDCDNAAPVNVADSDVPNIDFSLTEGGTISGTIYDSATPPAPITNDNLGVDVFTGDCDNMNYVGWANIDSSDGSFTTSALPQGTDYKLLVQPYNVPYIKEYWALTASVVDCESAQTVVVDPATDTPGKNFQLDPAMSISGTVTTGNPSSPVVDLEVFASTTTSGDWIEGTTTDNDGMYTLYVPAGEYKISTCSECTVGAPFPYIDEYWDNTTSFDNASPVDVTSGDVSDIDFFLEEGASISGTIYNSQQPSVTLTGNIEIEVYTGDPCGGFQWIGGTQIDSSDGSYNISGLPQGTYFLRTFNRECDFFVGEYYDDDPDTRGTCGTAAPITIDTDGQQEIDKHFYLDTGGLIKGTVTDSGGIPIDNVWVAANDQSYNRGSNTQADGTYCFSVPAVADPGIDYKVDACPSCSWPRLPYYQEYYDNKYTWDTATPVNVRIGAETPFIDFALDSVLPGDIDGDGDMDLADAIFGLQIITATQTNGYVPAGCDVNADGVIGIADVIYILRNL